MEINYQINYHDGKIHSQEKMCVWKAFQSIFGGI